MMKKFKEIYSQPTTNVLVVRCEQGILGVSGGANYSSTPGGAGGDDAYDDGDSF